MDNLIKEILRKKTLSDVIANVGKSTGIIRGR